jgi:hypothetical protein
MKEIEPEQTKGTLGVVEHHPAAYSAMEYIRNMDMQELLKCREAFASTAIEGNRLSEVCGETLQRLIDSEPVSDRYLLGLAWTVSYSERRLP